MQRWNGAQIAPFTLPRPGEFTTRPGSDASVVAITGVLQCTVISIYDRITGTRIVAHFGGFRGQRQPGANALRGVFSFLLTRQGGLHSVDIRIAGNSNSPELSLDEAEDALRQLHPAVHVQRDTYGGQRFFVDQRGRIYGLEDDPNLAGPSNRGGGFLGSRGGAGSSRGFTMGSRGNPKT